MCENDVAARPTFSFFFFFLSSYLGSTQFSEQWPAKRASFVFIVCHVDQVGPRHEPRRWLLLLLRLVARVKEHSVVIRFSMFTSVCIAFIGGNEGALAVSAQFFGIEHCHAPNTSLECLSLFPINLTNTLPFLRTPPVLVLWFLLSSFTIHLTTTTTNDVLSSLSSLPFTTPCTISPLHERIDVSS